ncbi:HTH-type transcriptional regulator VirS [Pseudoruegeria aquimaris]|uniref:HTH-type transcriptional regulator VirS n=1 Tax=Pseudoruegeria aquimaris TaxID=393663 RepID=A0A1Y5S2W6_9RHOB|nr:helix-turn-helix transcriptional regulator [Pseudoruegeria aquimaris]SLN31468.1 HTH-type transcriptional regulator VirS [Pseudoruegeria aquimaris]
MHSSEARVPMTPRMGLFEILYITECARCFTGLDLVPAETTLPGALPIDAKTAAFLGGAPKPGGVVSLTFRAEDADLPLITRNASLWETLEPGFSEQLAERLGTDTMAGRLKQALSEALPGGATTNDAMARRLNISKRSLQRRLTEEGTSFQALLGETRFELSERYLKDSALSVPEISFLLGFRDASSFLRAFQGWTGLTPGDYRAAKAPEAGMQVH